AIDEDDDRVRIDAVADVARGPSEDHVAARRQASNRAPEGSWNDSNLLPLGGLDGVTALAKDERGIPSAELNQTDRAALGSQGKDLDVVRACPEETIGDDRSKAGLAVVLVGTGR